MNKIEEFDYINNLYSFYKELLTDKQKEVIESYYLYNLSLSEIGDNLKISRSAVNDALIHAKDNLIEYEQKLKLFEKENKVKEVLDKENISKEVKEKILEVI